MGQDERGMGCSKMMATTCGSCCCCGGSAAAAAAAAGFHCESSFYTGLGVVFAVLCCKSVM